MYCLLTLCQFVTRKTPAEVAKVEAYVLFYQKKSLEKQAERDEILTQIEKEVEAHHICGVLFMAVVVKWKPFYRAAMVNHVSSHGFGLIGGDF